MNKTCKEFNLSYNLSMKRFILLLCLPLTAFANPKFNLEPLYGVETSLVRFPEPARYVTRAMYGARAVYGVTGLSGELEYSQAHSRNDYPSKDQKVEDSSQRLALGLRSTIPMGKFLGLQFRAGGRAAQGKTEITTSGVKETKDNPLRIDPYAGAGLQIAVSSNFALNAGATLVRNEENKFDTQFTLGLTARFGKL